MNYTVRYGTPERSHIHRRCKTLGGAMKSMERLAHRVFLMPEYSECMCGRIGRWRENPISPIVSGWEDRMRPRQCEERIWVEWADLSSLHRAILTEVCRPRLIIGKKKYEGLVNEILSRRVADD